MKNKLINEKFSKELLDNYVEQLRKKHTAKYGRELLKKRQKIDLSEYENLNYDELKFKAGLEIHQQLDTHKLFCECDFSDDSYDFEVRRKLHISFSETDELDEAAMYEIKKNKTFVYRGNSKNVCLVELDEEPPHEMNREALMITLQCCKLFDANVVDEIQVMRKIVLDGSNTTGFQRTALVGFNGKIATSKGYVKIETICLEEDAAKIIERKENEVIYHLNRLGVPLIEIATDASIKSPEHLKEVAKEIGLTLRSLKVRRGLGTIRQDLNISIMNGNRVEIKGAQDLKHLDLIAKYEVIRQLRLYELMTYLNEITDENFEFKPKALNDILKNTENKILKNALNKGNIIMGVKIEKFSNVFGFELLPNLRFGSELAGIAKLFGLKGIFHSDELRQLKYGFKADDIKSIESALNVKEEDGYIIIAGNKEQLKHTFEMIHKRIIQAFYGVPKDVRKVNADFTTSFLRPMPGAARMYPETDVMPIKINFDVPKVEHLKQRIERYKKLLPKDMAEKIAMEDTYRLFEQVNEFKNIKPTTFANLLLNIYEHNEVFNRDKALQLFKLINDSKISIVQAETLVKDLENIDEKLKQLQTFDINSLFNEIEQKIKEYIKEGHNDGKIISLIMNVYKTKYNPRELIQFVKETIKKYRKE